MGTTTRSRVRNLCVHFLDERIGCRFRRRDRAPALVAFLLR